MLNHYGTIPEFPISILNIMKTLPSMFRAGGGVAASCSQPPSYASSFWHSFHLAARAVSACSSYLCCFPCCSCYRSSAFKLELDKDIKGVNFTIQCRRKLPLCVDCVIGFFFGKNNNIKIRREWSYCWKLIVEDEVVRRCHLSS